MPKSFDELFAALDNQEFLAGFLVAQRVCGDAGEYRSPDRGKVGVLYCFAETLDNTLSGLARAAQLVSQGYAGAVALCDGETEHGYPGLQYCTDRLREIGYTGAIVPVRVDGNVHTLNEANALVGHAVLKSRYDKDVAVVAPSLHILRAFMTTATAARKHNIRVFAHSGMPLAWGEQVRHSQGTLQGTRAALLMAELERLLRYRAPENGGMMTFQETLAYLNWRDGVR